MTYSIEFSSISKAAQLLKGGHAIAVPTETVYGLAARCDMDKAIQQVFHLKQRPSFNPLIVHCYTIDQINALAYVSDLEQKLIETYAPGPLTLVLKKRHTANLSPLVTAGLDTVAVRIPAHPIMRSLLEAVNIPLAAPSANRSEHISPTRLDHVKKAFPKLFVLDGGPCLWGVESTILQVENEAKTIVNILRPGTITPNDMKHDLDLIFKETSEHTKTYPVFADMKSQENAPSIVSPGQLKRHYAPTHKLRINTCNPQPGEAFLSFGVHANKKNLQYEKNLSPKGCLVEAAQNLYAYLRYLDHLPINGIAVMPIPQEGIGKAINDRLHRASTPVEI